MKPEVKKILNLSSEAAAPLLLGWTIVRRTPEGTIRLKIVETESYHQNDPASHSFRGITPRTAPMFKDGGTIYVYFTYGMHYCLNIVTGKKGVGEAVLLRAGEPLAGIKIMCRNRFGNSVKGLTSHSAKGRTLHNLANGPAKLTQALGIKDISLSGQKFGSQTLSLEPPQKAILSRNIASTPRIGIREKIKLSRRFYIKNSLFVTKHRYNKIHG